MKRTGILSCGNDRIIGVTTRTMTTPEGFIRVRVGPFPTRAAADDAVPKLDVEEEPFVVRLDETAR